jgi:hypothetical protein
MWTGLAECYGVTPVVAVVPLLNQILSILNKRTLLIRLTRQLQIQVLYIGRGQLRVQVNRHVISCGYKYRGRGQLRVQVQRQGSAAGTSASAGVSCGNNCRGRGQLRD